jgi:phosphoribosyl 1,2-cyclic phosphodiesterase
MIKMTININKIASGSSGNCFIIEDSNTSLMIECGVQFPLIQKALDFRLSKIDGCLISHEHKDHCISINKIIQSGIKCYTSKKTFKSLKINTNDYYNKCIKIEAKKMFSIGSFDILPFNTNHDAEDPLGFLIRSGSEKILFATDTSHIIQKFKGLTHIVVECNYDINLLAENVALGIYPNSVRKRIIKTHFELQNVKEFIRVTDKSRLKTISLIHISPNNGNREFFKEEIQKLTNASVLI